MCSGNELGSALPDSGITINAFCTGTLPDIMHIFSF